MDENIRLLSLRFDTPSYEVISSKNITNKPISVTVYVFCSA